MSESDDREREIAELKERIAALEGARDATPVTSGPNSSNWIGRLERVPLWARVLIFAIVGVGLIAIISRVIYLPHLPSGPQAASSPSATSAGAAASVAAASADSAPSNDEVSQAASAARDAAAAVAAATPAPDMNATSHFKAVLTCEVPPRGGHADMSACFAREGGGTDLKIEEDGIKKVYNYMDIGGHPEIDIDLLPHFSIQAQNSSEYAKLHLVIYRISDGGKIYDAEAGVFEVVEFEN